MSQAAELSGIHFCRKISSFSLFKYLTSIQFLPLNSTFLITHHGTFDLKREDLELKGNENFPVADRSDIEWHYT